MDTFVAWRKKDFKGILVEKHGKDLQNKIFFQFVCFC